MAKINFEDKEDVKLSSLPRKNKIIATDINEIKQSVNDLYDEKEDVIEEGEITEYYRGDKTFQTLDKTAVGLSNVDNTSDADKPISSAQQTALDDKQDELVSGTNIKTINSESLLGSGNITISANVFYDDVSPTPLPIRGKLRALEYIELVDNPTSEETEIQLRADSLLDAETTRFGENGAGNVDLKIEENKLLTGDVNGFATEYTATAECVIGLDSNNEILEFETIEIYNILKEEGITGDKTLTLTDITGASANVKAKFEISAIAVQNTTANAVTINIGSTALGTDVVNAFALGASETKKLPLSTTFFSITSGQNLFISSGSWNSANINIHVTISKIWQ